LVARPATTYGPEYDDLWATALDRFSIACGVVRSPASVRYKHGGNLVVEVRAAGDDALVGYAAVKRQTSLLVDLLARSPADLSAVLGATRDWLALAPDGIALKKTGLKAMETPVLSSTLETLGFTPVDYRFAFVCTPLDPSISADAVAPERWYIMPGD